MTTDVQAVPEAGGNATHASTAGRNATIAKNLFAAFVLLGSWIAVETGYFSNDRTSRNEWNEMERLKAAGKARTIYETSFDKDVFSGSVRDPGGRWGYYNGADGDTVSVKDGAFELNYTEAWIGSEFRQGTFKPNGVYRVTIEAKVEGQPAAILMRNRQLDLMREQVPVTDGAFRTHSYFFVAPGGRFDQVNVIFMPDAAANVKGRMTVRKFRIEQLGG